MIERTNRIPALFTACALGFVALLGGCRVGPPYHAPAPPSVTAPNYKESTVNFQDTDGWKVASPQDAMIRGNWWEVFGDPELNALEDQLNINNQNLKEYFENYMAARATIAEARSQYWPTITANPSWNRSKSSGTLNNSTQANVGKQSTLWNAPIDVSWTPDFWGKIRNEVHEAEYASQVSAADLQTEKLTEQASLAEYFFEIRGQDMLQQILNQTVADRTRNRWTTLKRNMTPASAITSRLPRPRRQWSPRRPQPRMWAFCARNTNTPSLCCWASHRAISPFP